MGEGLNSDDFKSELCAMPTVRVGERARGWVPCIAIGGGRAAEDARLTPMTWRLYKVDIPVPSAPRTTGLSDEQCCLDPRLS